jgi:hypothetical protein
MAINLATKYSSKIAEKFIKESYVAGNASEDYDWAGVRSITVYTPQTVDLNDYNKTATADRFGTTVEVQDEVQEMVLTKDKSFSLSIDRGNNIDQQNTKAAGKILNLQIKEKTVPYMDKYIIDAWARKAGTIGVTASAPTKSTIITLLKGAATALDNAEVPDNDRTVYIPATYHDMVQLSDEFQKVQTMLGQVLQKGYKGDIFGMKTIRVPDGHFPTSCYFLITYKNSVLAPNKIKMMRILTEVKGIDGSVLEGRNYFDAFVLGAKALGVYSCVLTASKAVAPVITAAGGAVTQSDATTIYATIDGSDPRYSKTRQTVASTAAVVGHASGIVCKAYCERTGYFPSDVTTETLSA